MSKKLIIAIVFIVLISILLGFLLLVYILQKPQDSDSDSDAQSGDVNTRNASDNIDGNVNLCKQVTSPKSFNLESGQSYIGRDDTWYVAQPLNGDCDITIAINDDGTAEFSSANVGVSANKVKDEGIKGWVIQNDTDSMFDFNVLFVDTDRETDLSIPYIQNGKANSITEWTTVTYQGDACPMYSKDQLFYIVLYRDDGVTQFINKDINGNCLNSGAGAEGNIVTIKISSNDSGDGQVEVEIFIDC